MIWIFAALLYLSFAALIGFAIASNERRPTHVSFLFTTIMMFFLLWTLTDAFEVKAMLAGVFLGIMWGVTFCRYLRE